MIASLQHGYVFERFSSILKVLYPYVRSRGHAERLDTDVNVDMIDDEELVSKVFSSTPLLPWASVLLQLLSSLSRKPSDLYAVLNDPS